MIFEKVARNSFGVSVGNTLIAAPGAGLSIYIQNIEGDAGAAFVAAFHAPAALVFGVVTATAGNIAQTVSFPGGFKIPANQALQVDVFLNTANVGATYTIGPG